MENVFYVPALRSSPSGLQNYAMGRETEYKYAQWVISSLDFGLTNKPSYNEARNEITNGSAAEV